MALTQSKHEVCELSVVIELHHVNTLQDTKAGCTTNNWLTNDLTTTVNEETDSTEWLYVVFRPMSPSSQWLLLPASSHVYP